MIFNWWRMFLVSFLGACLGFSVSAGAEEVGKTTKSPTLSKFAVQLTVPYFKQETSSLCGLAVVQMICDYYKQKLNQTQKDWLKTIAKSEEGLAGSELVSVLRAADYYTAVFPGTLEGKKTGLYYHLDKKRPVIVMISSKDGKNSHYDVVTGYDAKQSLLLMMDPASGPITVSTSDFSGAWKRANCFTLLAMPRKQVEAKTPTP